MDKPTLPAFYRIVIFLSLFFDLVLIGALVAALFILPPVLGQLMGELSGLENAVITTTVVVDQPMPVRGVSIQVLEPLTVRTTTDAPIHAAEVTMFLGGGSMVVGSTNINMPAGTQLPIDFDDVIVMSTTIPVRLSIPVSIPLKDTQVGTFAAHLRGMLAPVTDLLGIK